MIHVNTWAALRLCRLTRVSFRFFVWRSQYRENSYSKNRHTVSKFRLSSSRVWLVHHLGTNTKEILHLRPLFQPSSVHFWRSPNWSWNTCKSSRSISYNVVSRSKSCRMKCKLLIILRVTNLPLLTSTKHIRHGKWLLDSKISFQGLQNFALGSKFVVSDNILEILQCSILKHVSYANTLSRSSQWRLTRLRSRISV